MRPRLALALLLAAAFAALAVGVAYSDGLHRLDQAAVRDAMPGLSPHSRRVSVLASAIPFRHASLSGREAIGFATNVWTLPASPIVSALLFAGGALLLWRRGRRRAAVAWIAVWVAGNAVELLTKQALTRPALYALDHGRRVHIVGFDQSYPSGHTIRSILLAALVAALWARAGAAAAVWAAIALPLLLLAAFHTPTDIVGGALLAGLLILLVPLAARDTARP